MRQILDSLRTMSASQACTRQQRRRAVNVNLSTFLGWLMVAAPYILPQINPIARLFVAVIGPPILYIVCLVAVAPILRKIMRRPISQAYAACWGAIISSFIAATSIAIGRYLGWRQSINPNSYSRIGGDNSVRSSDDIPLWFLPRRVEKKTEPEGPAVFSDLQARQLLRRRRKAARPPSPLSSRSPPAGIGTALT